MGRYRVAVGLSIAVAALGVIDIEGLAAMADLLADHHLPGRLCNPRFLQQLEALRPLRLFGPLKPLHAALVLSRTFAPGFRIHHTGETT